MKKSIVVYYSNKGNNKFIAEKIANTLKCDIELIKPRLNVFFFLMIFSLLKKSLGIWKIKHDLNEYESIILCGPIWMGKFLSPLRDFCNKYFQNIKKLYFITCCGSGDAIKDKKFGHGLVFNEVKNLLGDKCIQCIALPIGLTLPEDKQNNSELIMKTRLTDDNFNGQIKERFDKFITETKF